MEPILPNRVLTARQLDAMRRAAEMGAAPLATEGIEIQTVPGGVIFSSKLSAYTIEDCVRARLTPWETAPLWGVAELYGAIEARYADPILECRKPTQSGFARLGIFRETMGANKIGWVQIRGYAPVLYITSSIPSGTTLAEGHRLGCLRASYYAQWDTLGPFKVRDTQGTTSDGYGVAIVEITRERADYKMVNTSGQADGAYQTIVWSPTEYTVTNPSPGNVTVATA